MTFVEWPNSIRRTITALFAVAALALAPAAMAQETLPSGVEVEEAQAGIVPAVEAEAELTADTTAAGAYTPMAPTPGKGMPVDGEYGFQDQYSEIGQQAVWMHDIILMPIITIISLFVLGLLLWVMYRYRAGRNQTPSKTAHNTTIEVIWTLLPVLILLGIAIPSIDLLAKQYKPANADAVTVKVTGYQWYWGYSYPDHGEIEIISNMLPEADAIANGEPPQLAVDNRMVVPVGEEIRIQTTAADVIHSFAVPSLWYKMDAVPGRINEKKLTITEPGVYYGQCMELCGIKHGYMPIAIEALPRPQFEQWVLAQGGSLPGSEPAAASETAPDAEADAAAEEGAEAELEAAA